jgi:hypothetical protein
MKHDLAHALERLRGRDLESLAAFIVSVALDSGPIGEQVRTFIRGNVTEAVKSFTGVRRSRSVQGRNGLIEAPTGLTALPNTYSLGSKY